MSARRPRWLENWIERHQSRLSFWLHMAGIPLTIAAVVLAGYQFHLSRWDLWWRPATLLAVGYLLQFLGHLYEGNDMGEAILIKRLLGRPYIAVAPPRHNAAFGRNQRQRGNKATRQGRPSGK